MSARGGAAGGEGRGGGEMRMPTAEAVPGAVRRGRLRGVPPQGRAHGGPVPTDRMRATVVGGGTSPGASSPTTSTETAPGAGGARGRERGAAARARSQAGGRRAVERPLGAGVALEPLGWAGGLGGWGGAGGVSLPLGGDQGGAGVAHRRPWQRGGR